MAMPEGSKMGKGSGTVAAIDAAAGQTTLDHGAIPSVAWPAMKMGFSAKPTIPIDRVVRAAGIEPALLSERDFELLLSQVKYVIKH